MDTVQSPGSGVTTPPNGTISKAALLHVGFDEAKATRLWDKWTSWDGE